MTSTERAMPDAVMTPVEAMSLPEISRELAAYRPGTAAEVIAIEEWMARRMQLWRRLDQLARPGGGITPQRGSTMTNIVQFRPKYPVLYVYRGWTLPDRVPVWVWDYFLDAYGGCIVHTSIEKPSLRELRDEYECPVIIDED